MPVTSPQSTISFLEIINVDILATQNKAVPIGSRLSFMIVA